ncbi:MAG TPA: antibiotic biosynthesis monooxygenase [Tepidiformaceae bacterium]|nr:antibiotic biosynthesis monooxygenase [Tepidiformaceae bacterium]
MTYIRLSIARPRRGDEQRFEEVMRRLAQVTAEQEGCVASYIMKPDDDSGEIARLTFYENAAQADHAAQGQTIMSLRSELHLISDTGHIERAFTTI